MATKTMTQGLAILCKALLKYLNKHDAALQQWLGADQYACATGLITCLKLLAKMKNKEVS